MASMTKRFLTAAPEVVCPRRFARAVRACPAPCAVLVVAAHRRLLCWRPDWQPTLQPAGRRHRRQRDAFLRRLGGEILAGIDEAIALEIVLFIVELFVPAVGDEQLLMRAVFDNLAAFEYQNLIGAPNRRQTVCDHERRPAAPQGPQAILNLGFALRVETRGRLVQHQDPRIGENRARDRDALPLAARQLDAAL